MTCHATVEAVEATTAAEQSTLEQMKAIEEMRRTLRDERLAARARAGGHASGRRINAASTR